MRPVVGRIFAALGANAFGQAVTIGIQLASLPAFLAVWTPAEYGIWLMLSALTAYLSMADVGLVTAVGNEMTMAVGRGDRQRAVQLFHGALAFMLVVCGTLAAVSLAFVGLAPIDALQAGDRRIALAALMMTAVLALFGGLADAQFRATGRYADGVVIANLIRLGEWLGWMAGLALVGSLSAVAVCGLAVRMSGVWIMFRIASRGDQGIALGVSQARLTDVRGLATPALSFMAFPLANALNFQGMTLLVGHFFGPAALAVFNTYRTLTRVAVQLSAMFSHSIWPELSRLYGQGRSSAVRFLYARSAAFCGLLAIGLSLLLFFAAPWLLRWWTHGEIEMRAGLMAWLLLAGAVAGAWNVPRVLLMATNQHTGLAGWVVATAGLSLLLSLAAAPMWGLPGVGAALVAAEAISAVVCFTLAQRALQRLQAMQSD